MGVTPAGFISRSFVSAPGLVRTDLVPVLEDVFLSCRTQPVPRRLNLRRLRLCAPCSVLCGGATIQLLPSHDPRRMPRACSATFRRNKVLHPTLLFCWWGNIQATLYAAEERPEPAATGYSDVWKIMFSSTDSCVGVPAAPSEERVASTRKLEELVSTV